MLCLQLLENILQFLMRIFCHQKTLFIKALPYFTENNIAFVQTRWGHANEKKSMLTRIQALTLDMHFTVEQGGRFCKW